MQLVWEHGCQLNPFTHIESDSTCGINTIRFECIVKCINLQLLSDAMQVECLVTLRCYVGKRVKQGIQVYKAGKAVTTNGNAALEKLMTAMSEVHRMPIELYPSIP